LPSVSDSRPPMAKLRQWLFDRRHLLRNPNWATNSFTSFNCFSTESIFLKRIRCSLLCICQHVRFKFKFNQCLRGPLLRQCINDPLRTVKCTIFNDPLLINDDQWSPRTVKSSRSRCSLCSSCFDALWQAIDGPLSPMTRVTKKSRQLLFLRLARRRQSNHTLNLFPRRN
jgi:hypothetical protein